MGAWGSGLYSSDFALDVRSAVKAVARLPLPLDKLLEAARLFYAGGLAETQQAPV